MLLILFFWRIIRRSLKQPRTEGKNTIFIKENKNIVKYRQYGDDESKEDYGLYTVHGSRKMDTKNRKGSLEKKLSNEVEKRY